MRRRNSNSISVIGFLWILARWALTDPWTRACLIAFAAFEVIYWSNPQWAENIGLHTNEGDRAAQLEHCKELVQASCPPSEVVYLGDQARQLLELPEWTPMRVEQKFDSGTTVVSALGPHANFQYLVVGLELPEGSTFRLFQGAIVELS